MNDSDIYIRLSPFNEIIESMFYGKNRQCSYSSDGCASNFLSIGPKGNIYPCGRFCGIEKFKMGNINNNSMKDILNSKVHNDMIIRKYKLECYHKCEFFNICGGGCTYESYASFGDLYQRTAYCKSRKIIFSHIYNDLRIRLNKNHETNLINIQ